MEKRQINNNNNTGLSKKVKSNSFWEITDVVRAILLFVPIEDLFGLNLVCKMWNIILSDEKFWKVKVFIEFPSLSLLPKQSEIKWKEWVKIRFNYMEWKKSFSLLKDKIVRGAVCDNDMDNLITKLHNDRQDYKLFVIHEPCHRFIYQKRDEIYRDFLIASCCIYEIFREGTIMTTKFSAFNTKGEKLDLVFECNIIIDDDETSLIDLDELIIFDFEISISQTGDTKKRYNIGPEATIDDISGIYNIFHFPERFSFKVFCEQLIKICQKRLFPRIMAIWTTTMNITWNYEHSVDFPPNNDSEEESESVNSEEGEEAIEN